MEFLEGYYHCGLAMVDRTGVDWSSDEMDLIRSTSKSKNVVKSCVKVLVLLLNIKSLLLCILLHIFCNFHAPFLVLFFKIFKKNFFITSG